MTTPITPDQLRALAGAPRGVAPTKYRSRSVWVEELGRRFSSQREADAAVTLWRRQQKGEIRDLRFQVPYRLAVAARTYVGLTAPVTPVCTYVADFVWREDAPLVVENPSLTADGGRLDLVGWREVVADAKGYRTPVYKLKARLMLALYGIRIVEL